MILLTTLNSKYVHSSLALKYLYTAAEPFWPKLRLKEFTINNEEDYVFMEILRGGYNCICFSCYIWNIDRILALAENLKKVNPELTILLGGPEVSFDSVQLMRRFEAVDFVLSGEGDLSFPAFLAEYLSENPSYESVKGLSWRRSVSGGTRRSGFIEVNESGGTVPFEQVPFPYRHFSVEEDKVLYYEASRGCPFSCSYCLSSVEKQVRAMPLSRVWEDLTWFLVRRVRQVKFIDRTFNFDRERAYNIFDFLIDNDNGYTNFHFEICADLLDDRTLALLFGARTGLFQFEVGVQSTNEKALAACNRRCDFEKLRRNVKLIKRRGNIHLHLDLIAGLPYEDYESFRKSFNDVYEMEPDQLQLGFLKLIKGSPLRGQTREYGYLYRRKAPYEVLGSNFLSPESMMHLKMIENVLDLYYNRGGYEDTLIFCTEELADSAFDFYEELSNFFYLRGYQHRSHKKEDLYRILYQYACWKERSCKGVLEKMMLFLEKDLIRSMNPDAVKKFRKKGWDDLL